MWTDDFPGMALPNLVAGLVIGFTMVIIAMSLASLFFSGPLAADLPCGIAIALVTWAITSILQRSSLRLMQRAFKRSIAQFSL